LIFHKPKKKKGTVYVWPKRPSITVCTTTSTLDSA
jgi:hypothetical protein